MKSFAEQWKQYATVELPYGTPPLQLQELKRAFYAGARALSSLQRELATSGEGNGAAVRQLELWLTEVHTGGSQ